jgi:hypothetical protein
MKTRIISSVLMCLSVSLLMTACKKDAHSHNDEGELITTVKLTFTEGNNLPSSFTWKDIDGPGGNNPEIQTISLKPNTSYSVKAEFLNEQKNPAEDITEEILEEANDHEVFYQTSNNFLTITRTDLDTNTPHLPLGLESTWATQSLATGSIKVILKHKPGTKAAGDPATKGETDIEVNFPLEIK